MFTEFCKRHFNVKLFNYIFDTLFSIFFELLRIALILLDPIFTGHQRQRIDRLIPLPFSTIILFAHIIYEIIILAHFLFTHPTTQTLFL